MLRSIFPRFHWYKNHKNRASNAGVIIENKVARFLWFTAYVCVLCLAECYQRPAAATSVDIPKSANRASGVILYSQTETGDETEQTGKSDTTSLTDETNARRTTDKTDRQYNHSANHTLYTESETIQSSGFYNL